MLHIRTAGPADVAAIIEVAQAAWGPTYSPILSPEQVVYMYQAIFQPQVVEESLSHPHTCSLLAWLNNVPVGFAISSTSGQPEGKSKLSKFYLCPGLQGQGIGGRLMEALLEGLARQETSQITLNVNRYNEKAIRFYKKWQFEVVQEVDLPFGPYWMNDYIMERPTRLSGN
jgi:ribosomal protein S18 acetylase RimI-like enzyme